jgi:hypothetical protein
MKKDLRKLMREARQCGWTIRQTGSSHWLWIAPDGQRFYSASSPGDPRTIYNIKADLRRITLRRGGLYEGRGSR